MLSCDFSETFVDPDHLHIVRAGFAVRTCCGPGHLRDRRCSEREFIGQLVAEEAIARFQGDGDLAEPCQRHVA